METNKLGAIVVIFEPDNSVIENIKKIAEQFDITYVFNNACNDCILDKISKISGVKIIGYGINVGIAHALSEGTNQIIKDGFSYITTFDQDTIIPDNFRYNIEESIKVLKNIDPKFGIIGANYIDLNLGSRSPQINLESPIIKRSIPKNNYMRVTNVISSGSTFRASLHQKIGLYMDDFFIDYVDNEICYRAIKNGFTIYISPLLNIEHTLGERKEFKIGPVMFRPTNHNPLRKYYITRNRIYCIKKYAISIPGLLPFEIFAILNDIIRIVFFEKNRYSKLINILRGFIESFAFSPIAAKRVSNEA